MIVSGSLDLTCILWDLEELSYITQLTGHAVGVSALAFNDLTVSDLTLIAATFFANLVRFFPSNPYVDRYANTFTC